VRPAGGGPWTVTPDDLARAVSDARGRGLDLVGAGDALALGRHAAAVTFDDAFLSVYEVAYPLLNALGVAATVFVPVDYVGRTSTYDEAAGLRAAEPIMTWAQLAELAAHGWSVESHGCAHAPLAGFGAARLDDELRRSKAAIEDAIGRRVRGFAYPYGVVPGENGDAGRLLEGAGYEYGVLASGGAARTPPPQPYRVPREPVAPGQRISFAVGD